MNEQFKNAPFIIIDIEITKQPELSELMHIHMIKKPEFMLFGVCFS